METTLQLDDKTKHLGLLFKKRFEHSSDVQLKVKGVLDTVTAQAQFDATLQKFFRIGRAPTFTAGDPFQPDARLRLAVGAKASAVGGKAPTTDDTAFTVSAKKKFVVNKQQEVVRNRVLLRSYTQAVAAANYDYNLRTERWGGEVLGSVSHAIFRFTEEQDLRLTAGVRAPLTEAGLGEAQPFLRLQENCWGITFDRHGSWRVTYDL